MCQLVFVQRENGCGLVKIGYAKIKKVMESTITASLEKSRTALFKIAKEEIGESLVSSHLF